MRCPCKTIKQILTFLRGSFYSVIEPVDFVDAWSESVGKLWSAGTLTITYPHGSARIGP